MRYQVKHTFGNVLHEGTKYECDLVIKAFTTYGISDHKLELVEVVGKLSEAVRDGIIGHLTDMVSEAWDRDDMYSAITDGYEGFNDMVDDELVELFSNYVDPEDTESELTDLYMKACSEIGVEEMLSTEKGEE
jgi:hypothetical protein